jgi:hypothetical protein
LADIRQPHSYPAQSAAPAIPATLGSAGYAEGQRGYYFSDANLRVRVINVASNNSRDCSLDWVAGVLRSL